ncbi:unnamed protein product [Sphenostylis stenocarpa]|uniref:Uncharacterized protein n=1 Tax=Sphenostylis stenocarpa TaxID=92480 RepID=A0AA86W1H0_9FABA|nr:unnamed protein product [Sphenostylis stenocarpa]
MQVAAYESRHVWRYLSAEQKLAASLSLDRYCKPTEFYNYLKDRATEHPRFLQRCLDYKIKAKNKKRVLMTVSLAWEMDETRSLFPLCISLGKEEPNEGPTGYCLQQYKREKSRTIWVGKANDSLMEGESKPIHISTGFETFGAARKPPPRRRQKRRHEGSSSSSLSHIIWQRGTVAFEYRYYHDRLHEIEVTENFTCAESEEYPFVSVSLKNPNWIPPQWVDPRLDTFLYCAKKPKRRRLDTIFHGRNDTDEVISDAELPTGDTQQLENVGSNPVVDGPDCVPSVSDSDNGSRAMQQVEHEEVSNAISHPRSSISDHDDRTLAIPEVDHEEVSNAILHPISTISDRENGTLVVLDADHEETSNTILHNGQEHVPLISAHDDGTRAMLEVDHEEVSNAILHACQEHVPSMSDHDDRTRAMVVVDHEEASNAIVLHTGQDCVPSTSDPDGGTRAMLQDNHEGDSSAIVLHTGQDCVPPISDPDDGTRAMQEDDHEGDSNAIMLHPGPDSVPSIPEHAQGTTSVPQVEEEERLLIEIFDPRLYVLDLFSILGKQKALFYLHSGKFAYASIRVYNRKCSVPHCNQMLMNFINISLTLFFSKHFSLARWKKRKFYHSHKYQDEDSEDEINEGAQEIEDRRKLACLKATEDEKRFVYMWTSFIKKQRVLADGHVNWACEAFTKYHCAEFAESPALAW